MIQTISPIKTQYKPQIINFGQESAKDSAIIQEAGEILDSALEALSIYNRAIPTQKPTPKSEIILKKYHTKQDEIQGRFSQVKKESADILEQSEQHKQKAQQIRQCALYLSNNLKSLEQKEGGIWRIKTLNGIKSYQFINKDRSLQVKMNARGDALLNMEITREPNTPREKTISFEYSNGELKAAGIKSKINNKDNDKEHLDEVYMFSGGILTKYITGYETEKFKDGIKMSKSFDYRKDGGLRSVVFDYDDIDDKNTIGEYFGFSGDKITSWAKNSSVFNLVQGFSDLFHTSLSFFRADEAMTFSDKEDMYYLAPNKKGGLCDMDLYARFMSDGRNNIKTKRHYQIIQTNMTDLTQEEDYKKDSDGTFTYRNFSTREKYIFDKKEVLLQTSKI